MPLESLINYIERGNLTSVLFLILFISITWNLSLTFFKWIKRRKTLPPGPIGLPFVGYLPFLGSEPHKKIWDMKEKYGDIIGMRFGSRYTIILNEHSAAKEVVSHLGALDRSPDLFKHITLGFGDSNGEKWMEQRRFCLSVSRDLGLGRSSWEALVMEEVHSFADEIKKSRGTPVDISTTLAHSVSSNIVSLLIGRKLNKVEEANKIKLSLDFADVSFSYTGPSDLTTVIPGLRKLLVALKIPGYRRAAEIIAKFQKFIKQEIFRHQGDQEVDDFINTYISKMNKLKNSDGDTKHHFSEEMLEGNVTVLFLGASDTIVSSLGWLFRLMADYKDVQNKVYREIMEIIGRDGAVKYEERHKIPYTFAVLMESQRFSSIVPLSTTRHATQDIPVKGFIIPKGAEITINLWGLHHDPKHWNEPNKFIPERFLTDDGTKLIKQPESFAPFSYGKRNCPGETVAWMEILSYFSHVVRNYEISFPPGVKPEYKVTTGLVERLVPQPLCFKERN